MTSYLGGIPIIVGNTLGQMLGDPNLLGVFGLLIMFFLWAYSGVGFDVGVIIFTPFILMLALYGFLPTWVAFVVALAVGIAGMRFFGVFR